MSRRVRSVLCCVSAAACFVTASLGCSSFGSADDPPPAPGDAAVGEASADGAPAGDAGAGLATTRDPAFDCDALSASKRVAFCQDFRVEAEAFSGLTRTEENEGAVFFRAGATVDENAMVSAAANASSNAYVERTEGVPTSYAFAVNLDLDALANQTTPKTVLELSGVSTLTVRASKSGLEVGVGSASSTRAYGAGWHRLTAIVERESVTVAIDGDRVLESAPFAGSTLTMRLGLRKTGAIDSSPLEVRYDNILLVE